MSYETPHRKYLRLADATVGLRGKSVLEVGGSSPPPLLADYSPRRWTCVNLNERAVSEFNRQASDIGLLNLNAVVQDVATFASNIAYDRIYSINCFEHIANLAGALERMHQALSPFGYLFTMFGPIWSSDIGHHLSIPTPKGPLHFFDGVLRPWEHLASTPEAIYAKLERTYGSEAARRAVDYIYRYPDLNRLFEHDYLALVKNSGLVPVMILRNRKGKAPKLAGATNTREFVMVLKKGGASPWEKALLHARFVWAYLKSRHLR
jgi:hypothetical protein